MPASSYSAISVHTLFTVFPRGSHSETIYSLSVLLALGARYAAPWLELLGNLMSPHLVKGDIPAIARYTVEDFGKRVAILQVRWILFPSRRPISVHLGHDDVTHASLQ